MQDNIAESLVKTSNANHMHKSLRAYASRGFEQNKKQDAFFSHETVSLHCLLWLSLVQPSAANQHAQVTTGPSKQGFRANKKAFARRP